MNKKKKKKKRERGNGKREAKKQGRCTHEEPAVLERLSMVLNSAVLESKGCMPDSCISNIIREFSSSSASAAKRSKSREL